MFCKRVEKLRQQYTGKHVSVDRRRPELARFGDMTAQVKTVNFSGRALVQFDGADRGWHDIELDHLKVIDRIASKTEAAQAPGKAEPKTAATATADTAEPADGPEDKQQLSRLELARMQKQSTPDAAPVDP